MNLTSVIQSSNDYIYFYLFSISIVGTIGNMVVVLVYWRKKDTQTSTFFILFLSFMDLTVCSILIPMIIYMEKIVFETDSIIFCKTYNFLTTTTVPSSSLLMTTIAFDRFFCICMVNRNIFTYQRAKYVAFSLLTFSLSLGIIPLMASVITINSRNINLGNLTLNISYDQCIVDMEGKQTMFGKIIIPFKFFYDALYVICVIIITILYIQIYKEIHKRRKIRYNQKRRLLYSSIINSGGVIQKNLFSRKQNIFNRFSNFFKKNSEYSFEKSYNNPETYSKNVGGDIPLINISKINNFKKPEHQITLKNDEYSDMIQSSPIKKNSILKNENRRKKKEATQDNSLSYFANKHAISSKDIRTAFMLFVVSCLYLIFYLPSITITYLTIFLPKISNNLYISYLYLSNSAINPIIYCFLNPAFRSELIKLFFKKEYFDNRYKKNTKSKKKLFQ